MCRKDREVLRFQNRLLDGFSFLVPYPGCINRYHGKVVSLNKYFVFWVPKKRPLLYANALHIFQDLDRVDPMNEHNAIACLQYDFFQQLLVIRVKLYRDSASLNHEHLLQITDFPLDLTMEMRRLGKAGFDAPANQGEERIRAEKRKLFGILAGPR